MTCLIAQIKHSNLSNFWIDSIEIAIEFLIAHSWASIGFCLSIYVRSKLIEWMILNWLWSIRFDLLPYDWIQMLSGYRIVLFTQCSSIAWFEAFDSIYLYVWFQVDAIEVYTNSIPVWFNSDRVEFYSISVYLVGVLSSALYDCINRKTEEFQRSRFLFVLQNNLEFGSTVQNFDRNRSFVDSGSIGFVWFDEFQFVRSKLALHCFLYTNRIPIGCSLTLYEFYTHSVSSYYLQEWSATIQILLQRITILAHFEAISHSILSHIAFLILDSLVLFGLLWNWEGSNS